MGKKLDDDITQAQDTLKCVRNMEEKYVTLIQQLMEEGGDPQLARNLEFTVPTAETLAKMYIKNAPYMDKNHDEVRATPIKNIVEAKELLENNRSSAPMETAVKLITKALVQQERLLHHEGSNLTLRCADPVLPPRPRAMAIMVLVLTMNLIPDPQRSEEEKLVTRPTLSQYPPMTGHMANAIREIPHHLTRITLLMADTIKAKLFPAIRPICHHQSIRHSRSLREEL
jgi:hypothetical protein